jgi:DNA polymerase V
MNIILLPKFGVAVAAGFPSAADDFLEAQLDLNEHLIKRPAATYLARAQGHSMVGRGIYDGDTLIVDRSIEPKHDDVVIAAIDGELTCKILDTVRQLLVPANPRLKPIAIGEHTELIIEGVVVHSIRHHVRAG